MRAKNNIAAKSKHQTLSFRFEENHVPASSNQRTGKLIWAPYIVWSEDYIDVSAFEAMQAVAKSKAPAARDDAMFFLLEMLKKGPVLSEIEETARPTASLTVRWFGPKPISRSAPKRAKNGRENGSGSCPKVPG